MLSPLNRTTGYKWYKEMILLFAKPYAGQIFDFGRDEFFDSLYNYGDKISKMPAFKQARRVKHFIYVN